MCTCLLGILHKSAELAISFLVRTFSRLCCLQVLLQEISGPWQVQASCRCLLIARFNYETQED